MTKSVIPVIALKPKEERRILRGHLWVYRNEVAVTPELQDGDVVDVFAANRRFIGRGFYQEKGGIAVRILIHHQNDIDRSFFHNSLLRAESLRKKMFPGSSVYRWVYGESDGLPGLIIDRYDSVAVVQSECAFYTRHCDALTAELLDSDGVESVLLRLPGRREWVGTEVAETALHFEDVQAKLNFGDAQKTGLFLDQRCNWQRIRTYAQGASVLDGYCYHGMWSIHAALAGAKSVVGVDTSPAAITHARENCVSNGLENCFFEQEDLEVKLAKQNRFDVIVLDPPAFAKHRTQTRKALARYESINRLAMNALHADGILISCSCSHFVTMPDFLESLKRAAAKSGRQAQLLEVHGAAPDHPVLLAMPETAYLKCAVLRIL
ncbi:MAG: class I SAM-dependent rRNA methyltransferase [Candidatus Hydrogenedentes bacterium]|nr:class I SAM-dependent rRNA methyltransferase [Candidatus Hydrogenedentota bacterium]